MVPVGGQKGLEIGLGNPNQSVDPVGYEKALLDPAANGSCRGVHTLGDLRDRVEFRRRFCSVGFH